MLGLRGCRLGLMIPDFVKIQTRAILNAADRGQEGRRQPDRQDHDPARRPRERARGDHAQLLEAEAEGRRAAGRRRGRLQVRHDDRGPARRPDRRRDRAATPTFFSFGTNDLTQMTFGYSRDDAEGGFLLKYVEDKILPVNPFQTLDDAVAGLMRIAVDKGRATRPDLELGICGEHGGDPELDRQVRGDRPRLRLLLAVPRPGRAARGGAGGPVRRRRARQVAPGARRARSSFPNDARGPGSGAPRDSPGCSPKVRPGWEEWVPATGYCRPVRSGAEGHHAREGCMAYRESTHGAASGRAGRGRLVSAALIAGGYAVIGITWILASDIFVRAVLPGRAGEIVGSVKGVGFVVVTTVGALGRPGGSRSSPGPHRARAERGRRGDDRDLPIQPPGHRGRRSGWPDHCLEPRCRARARLARGRGRGPPGYDPSPRRSGLDLARVRRGDGRRDARRRPGSVSAPGWPAARPGALRCPPA